MQAPYIFPIPCIKPRMNPPTNAIALPMRLMISTTMALDFAVGSLLVARQTMLKTKAIQPQQNPNRTRTTIEVLLNMPSSGHQFVFLHWEIVIIVIVLTHEVSPLGVRIGNSAATRERF